MSSEIQRGSFKPPFFPKEKFEQAACELLVAASKTLNEDLKPPIPVDYILEKHLKVTWEYKDMEKLLGIPHVLGATWIDDKLVRLDLALERQPGRLAFTFAHEIGHWQLHRPQIIIEREMPMLPGIRDGVKPPSIVCRSEDKRTKAEKQMEFQADQFAACLLMPAHFMKPAVAKLFPKGLRLPAEMLEPAMVEEKKDWFDAVAGMMIDEGGFTNCSRQAMRIRIEELRLADVTGTGSLF